MRAEIQIRTNGMDFWATLEHQLRYKQNIEEMDGYEDVSNELLNCARAVIDMDNEMQRIKNKSDSSMISKLKQVRLLIFNCSFSLFFTRNARGVI